MVRAEGPSYAPQQDVWRKKIYRFLRHGNHRQNTDKSGVGVGVAKCFPISPLTFSGFAFIVFQHENRSRIAEWYENYEYKHYVLHLVLPVLWSLNADTCISVYNESLVMPFFWVRPIQRSILINVWGLWRWQTIYLNTRLLIPAYDYFWY